MPIEPSHESSPYLPLVVRHLPLVRHAIDELGIPEVIDSVSPPDPRHRVTDGECVKVMILNVLQGRVSLYKMQEWLSLTDAELLLGRDVPVDAFNDDRLGHCLDRLFDNGTEFIFSRVAQQVLCRPEMGTSYSVHNDTTSVKLFGRYEEDPEDPWPAEAPRPKQGFSKDHRPDLKQLIFGLCLQGATRIPLGFTVLDGNTPDAKANRFQIESLTQLLPPEHDVTLVADSKFVDATTLGSARDADFHYISLLPRNYHLRRVLVEELRTSPVQLNIVGSYPSKRKGAPDRIYRATSVVRSFPVMDSSTGELRAVDHRFVIIRSTTKEAEFDSTIDKRVAKAEAALNRTLARLAKRDFACEADLRSATEQVMKGARYHRVDARFGTVEVLKKRSRRGRPRKGEPPPTQTVWRLLDFTVTRDEERIAVERFHAAHFVLITDHVDRTEWSDKRIFETWRSQQSIEGHAGFRWLKGVAEVAPVFLKLPHRIQALALVFMLALMVRNWIEFYMRTRLAETGEKLPNFLGKPISRPTAENLFYLFRGVTVLARVKDDAIVSRQVHFLDVDPYARDALAIFGLTERLFTTPPLRKYPDPLDPIGEM